MVSHNAILIIFAKYLCFHTHLDTDKHILQDLGKLKGCYQITMASGSEVSSDILTQRLWRINLCKGLSECKQ